MFEDERNRWMREFESMSDEQLSEKLLAADKKENPEIFEILWQEVKKRERHGRWHPKAKSEVYTKAAPAEKMILNLDTSVINIVVFILILNAIGTLIFFAWEKIVGLVQTDGLQNLWIVFIDIYFAFNLKQRKAWVRKWIVIRSVIGCLLWVVMDLSQSNPIGAVIPVVYFGAIIALLSGKIEKNLSKVLGFIAVVIIVIISSQNIDAILYHRNMLKYVQEKGIQSYSSEKFNYSISVPDGWLIIPREDFKNVDETLLETDGDIALLKNEGKGYGLVIPEKLTGYGVDYNLEALKNVFLEDLRKDPSVEMLSTQDILLYGDEGFEITYSAWVDGFHYKYIILYAVYENVAGMQLFAWSFESEGEQLYKEMHSIMANIEIGR